ncbi:interferon-induced protein 44-like isoform 1-T1 [Clarias gariepinus]|uniref:interferon-induced protein 44-like isoform X1 n=1 Tax=Clarias gariepinus TaxID=13013 RepID=UPI00234D585D|nr:interferon-induced protein 44-like isoform X1 [Clarias gariepinus]
MGNRLSTPSHSSPDLSLPAPEPAVILIPWRKIDCEDNILHEVKDFKPSTEVLRIVLYGPTGAGKSSFINSVQRVILGRNAMSALENNTHTGTSFTKKMNIHKLKSARGVPYPLEIVDIMGLQLSEGGIKQEDIVKAFQGHISDDYIFNPGVSITNEDPKYKEKPTLREKVHCLVCVLPADSVSRMDTRDFEQIKHVRDTASLLGIPQVIIMTKVDRACELVKVDLGKMYQSKKIKEKMDVCSVNVGIPLNAIYPVMNYSESITQDSLIDMFILTALRDILNFANDYVERELEKDD